MAAPNSQTTEHPIGGGQTPAYLGGPGGSIGFFQDPFGASFVASISGTTMAVTQMGSGTISVGQLVVGSGVLANTIVTALGTGTGGVGTYTVSVSQTVAQSSLGTAAQAATQPTDNAQSAITRGQASGVIACYVSTQSPSAVAQSTTAEQSLTIQTGTGAQMLLATGDMLFVNKPTSQAGLGYGNVRVAGSNSLGITFDNLPAGGNITPTASQGYVVVAARGLGNLTAVLSPAAVPANSAVEQQFSVVGLPAGALVQVQKPTAQAGLDIGGCRVVSSNVLGITFVNATAAAITPTAAESYTVVTTLGLDALNNDVAYGFNVGTVGAISAGVVVSGGSTTLTGVLATDMVTGIFKPTPQAAATNVATPIYGIPTSNTMTLYFLGTGTGGTPTASEVYGIRTWRQNPAAPLVLYNAAITPASVAALTTAEQTFTVTGLVAGSSVWINKPSWTNGLAILGCRVSAANTLAINFANFSSAAIVPPAETYVVGNFQVATPGAGNCVYQSVVPAINNTQNLANALRTALGPEVSGIAGGVNLIAGA